MSRITLNNAAELIRSNDCFLILCHRSPDGDTVGSAYALCRALNAIGKRCAVDCSDEIPGKYKYIVEETSAQLDFEPKCIIAADVADRSMLGKKYDGVTPDIVIDHHVSNTLYGKNNCVIDRAANCENIYALIKALGAPIDRVTADALYTGIATDTGCFKFSNTTADTHFIAAELIRLGADFENINRVMFDTKTVSRLEVERYAYDNLRLFADGKAAIVAIPHNVCEKAGASPEDLEGITSLPRQIEGVVLGITLREQRDGSLRVSVRTHPPIDASEFCKTFGGGGHLRAAGCSVAGSIEEATQELIKKAEQTLDEMK